MSNDPMPPAVVLVVDDEPAVNGLVGRYLTHLGYRVLEASTAEAALTLIRHRRPPIDLVLSDVVMPGTDGRELAATILETCPGPSVVLMSGGLSTDVARLDIRGQLVRVLRKPLDLDELQGLLQAMLEGFPAETEPEPAYLAG